MQRVTTSDNDYQWVVISANFSFFLKREDTKRKTKPWGKLWRWPTKLIVGTEKQEPKQKY